MNSDLCMIPRKDYILPLNTISNHKKAIKRPYKTTKDDKGHAKSNVKDSDCKLRNMWRFLASQKRLGSKTVHCYAICI